MKIAIIGMPNCGKTTILNALTGLEAQTTSFSSGRLEPNLAAVKVPDARLAPLNELYKPKKLTPAEVHYLDVGGFGGTDDRSSELPAELLNYLGGADAFLHVVRAFSEGSVSHPKGSVNPERDWQDLEAELILFDLALVERRVERLEKDVQKLAAQERKQAEAELVIFQRLLSCLEEGAPLREMSLSSSETEALRGYHLLSLKPQLVVINCDEDGLTGPTALSGPLKAANPIHICGKLEEELVQLGEDEAGEFMLELGIREAARNRVISESYRLLNLISFLTVGSDEVRAWTIRNGTSALEAAGAIHSDIERGFIRAEVISAQELLELGSLAQAKKVGKLRLEGKTYRVQDGDVCHFLFNV